MNRDSFEQELSNRCKRINQLEITIIKVLNGIDSGKLSDINEIYKILMEGMK